jgi:hypothetical protein
MRTGANVALQVGALVVAVLLRFTAPGWLLAILIFTVVGVLVLLLPPVLSLVVIRWRTLPPAMTRPFVATAGLLVLTALVLPDQGDGPVGATPLLVLLGRDGSPEWAWAAGMILVGGYLLAILWLGIAWGVTAERRRRRVA